MAVTFLSFAAVQFSLAVIDGRNCTECYIVDTLMYEPQRLSIAFVSQAASLWLPKTAGDSCKCTCEYSLKR